MTPTQHLDAAGRVFLDTAPVIYFVEAHPQYLAHVQNCFDRLDRGELTAVVSPVTLAECLIQPLRTGRTDLAEAFLDLLTTGPGTELATIDHETAGKAAELRAQSMFRSWMPSSWRSPLRPAVKRS